MGTTPRKTTFLMYHEIGIPGRPLASADPGYQVYCVPLDSFRAQLRALKDAGLRGMSVSGWAKAPETPGVVITFDDGCETDLLSAAPILRDLGFSATSYLTVDFLGRQGFLTREQARELASAGVEIGCHSMSHAFLSDIDDAALEREVAGAKLELERICGVPVRSFSCPGGRYDARTLRVAAKAGYETVTTSRAVQNARDDSRNELGRIAIMRDTSMEAFEGIVSGRGLRKQQVRDGALKLAKTILGNALYEKVRGKLLG